MRSSYSENDVILLLKDITGLVEPLPAKVREKLIQAGRHYSEMLPVEYVPTEAYMKVYQESLQTFAAPVANAIGNLADRIMEQRGRDVVLISLARAGIPIGILLKRYMEKNFICHCPIIPFRLSGAGVLTAMPCGICWIGMSRGSSSLWTAGLVRAPYGMN